MKDLGIHKDEILHFDEENLRLICFNVRTNKIRWIEPKKTNNDSYDFFLEEDLFVCLDDNGSMIWTKNGKYYRDGDKPAVVYSDGTKVWFKNGKLHRDGDKPAVVLSDGTMFWYKNGKYHRDGVEPAVVYSNGTKKWYKNGKQYYPK